MSSFIVANRPEAVYIFTDAAAYEPDGTLIGFVPKWAKLSTGDGVMFCRGDWHLFCDVAAIAEKHRASFDAVVDGLAFEANAVAEKRGNRPSEIGIAGWSAERQRLEVHLWANHDLWAGLTPGCSHRISAPFIGGCMADENYLRAIGWRPKSGQTIWQYTSALFAGDRFDARRHGLEFMEAQRHYLTAPGDFAEGDDAEPGAYLVGGWAEMATVTRAGVTSEILQVWPDRAGSKIMPEPLLAAVA